MIFTLDLSPELEQYLFQEANSRGLSLEVTALQLLKNSIFLKQKQAEAVNLRLFQDGLTEATHRIQCALFSNDTKLDLSNLGLHSVPPELGQLTNLTGLNLASNQITTLPPELGRLTNLTTLNLDENQIVSIPPELGRLTDLTRIYLDETQVTTLPLRLRHLHSRPIVPGCL
jgi:Leucine-rich repeat (LRR) protein